MKREIKCTEYDSEDRLEIEQFILDSQHRIPLMPRVIEAVYLVRQLRESFEMHRLRCLSISYWKIGANIPPSSVIDAHLVSN